MGKKKGEKLPKDLVRIALVLVLGAIAPMLDTTMVNIALNDFGRDFHASLDTVQWIMTGYVLAMGIAVPFSGWLVQRFEGKSVYLAAELLFLISSLLAGFSWNVESLIAFRLVQGFAAGLIIPLLTTLLVQTAGQNNMGKLMAIVGLPIILGPILGPVIGGLIAEYVSWRWIFFVNVPVGLIAMYFIRMKLPRFPASDRRAALDWIGILLLGGLSASSIYGISQAASGSGFGNAATIGFLASGVVLTVVYVLYALARPAKAIVPLRLLRFRSFTASVFALFLAGTGMNGAMLLLPLFFQNIRHDTVILAALSLVPQGLGMLLARPLIGTLTDRIGAKIVVLCALAITLVGTIPFVWFSAGVPYWVIGVVLFVRGIGIGGITIPVMTDAYTGLSRQQIPQASVATRIIQNIGGAFGSAVLATVVANQMNQAVPDLAHPASAYQTGFLVASAVTAVMVVPALFLTNKAKAGAGANM
ncbi:MDR family MFS transporter [Cohnella cellulosilytica]|uniref:MDR family MFS transporter n=1 Tax=Cohnella cellulosilytica TaxID=986710 RepID=A0ABW2FD52_9BACL